MTIFIALKRKAWLGKLLLVFMCLDMYVLLKENMQFKSHQMHLLETYKISNMLFNILL